MVQVKSLVLGRTWDKPSPGVVIGTTRHAVGADNAFLLSQLTANWMRAEIIFDFCIQSTRETRRKGVGPEA